MSETKIANVSAIWDYSLDCQCPACGEDVDLTDAPDFWDGYGQMKIGESKECETVWCPECGESFECSFEL